MTVVIPRTGGIDPSRTRRIARPRVTRRFGQKEPAAHGKFNDNRNHRPHEHPSTTLFSLVSSTRDSAWPPAAISSRWSRFLAGRGAFHPGVSRKGSHASKGQWWRKTTGHWGFLPEKYLRSAVHVAEVYLFGPPQPWHPNTPALHLMHLTPGARSWILPSALYLLTCIFRTAMRSQSRGPHDRHQDPNGFPWIADPQRRTVRLDVTTHPGGPAMTGAPTLFPAAAACAASASRTTAVARAECDDTTALRARHCLVGTLLGWNAALPVE